MSDYFKNINEIKFEGKNSTNPLSFRFYDENKIVMGKKMKDHLLAGKVQTESFKS